MTRARAPARLVLSRKGFDSGYGGMASPILPDGRLLPLPIPSERDRFRLRDLNCDDIDLGGLLRDLSGGRHRPATRVHLDPDLDRREEQRLPDWRPALGQTGAAHSHLATQGVGPDSLFLFFGWFRQIERHANRWRYVPAAPDLHLMFGWLEVDEVLSVVSKRQHSLQRHPWIANHPHVANPTRYDSPSNHLYIAKAKSTLCKDAPGGGRFTCFRPQLRLTAPNASRSVWRLPADFLPGDRPPLSYHSEPKRWIADGRHSQLRSVAKGQEFVLQLQHYPGVLRWAKRVIRTEP